MLGYVRTDAQELRVREHQYYRALYCGLCHRMGKCTGHCSRMTLQYDFVFLATLRLALTGEAVAISKQRCMIHPIRRRPTAQGCQALNFCADASALLVYRKLADDKCDEHGVKRLLAMTATPFLSGGYRRAKRRYPALDATIASHLQALSDCENGQASFESADQLAGIFGDLMAAVFSEGLDGTSARIAASMGRALGKWLYLVDAADDFEEDLQKGRFNPLRRSFGDTPTARDWENLRVTLTALLCEAERAFLLIDTYSAPEQREILANVLYLGLVKAGERYTKKPTQKEHTKGTITHE